jgi:hypothetical protein
VVFDFIIDSKEGPSDLSLELKGAVLCGYTGRDRAAVQRHIDELAKEGVAPPPSVPTFYPKPSKGLSLGGEIQLVGHETSGEAEFVLFHQPEGIYVALGSDHTDRDLERLDILKAKQVCDATLSRHLWRYEEVQDHWDQLRMSSWVTTSGERRLYQAASLAAILAPESLLSLVRRKIQGGLEGIAVFSGTTPILTEKMVFAETFEAELLDPVLQRRLGIGYTVRTLDWFRDEA